MSTAISGKTVVLTGTFTKLSRAEAEGKLAALGATIGKSLTKKTQLLIYGDKAGSKLAQAQRDGIEVRDEAWLMNVLAGGDGEGNPVAQRSGPLHDYLDRVMAWADKLRTQARVRVGLCRAPGVGVDRLGKMAEAWGLSGFSEDISNFYRQTDGLFLFWVDTNHPEYEDSWDPENPYYRLHYLDNLASQPIGVFDRLPQTSEIDSFPWEAGGILRILPAADALKATHCFYEIAYGVIPSSTIREAYGRNWQGESLEHGVRIFDASLQFYPVGFLMDPVTAEPPVIVGDDHGACWTDSRWATFEDYMESLLNQHFTQSVRSSLVLGHNPRRKIPFERLAPIAIDTLFD